MKEKEPTKERAKEFLKTLQEIVSDYKSNYAKDVYLRTDGYDFWGPGGAIYWSKKPENYVIEKKEVKKWWIFTIKEDFTVLATIPLDFHKGETNKINFKGYESEILNIAKQPLTDFAKKYNIGVEFYKRSQTASGVLSYKRFQPEDLKDIKIKGEYETFD